MKRNIFLIGFMGAGKSTISEYLNRTQGMPVIEMDEEIVRREGMAIKDIFAQKGEEYFRNVESQLLSDMKKEENVVVSCGGGVPMREKNVELMRESGYIVLLSAKPEAVYERVKDDDSRPLLNQNMSVEYIAQLMEKRRPKYEAAADITVDTSWRSVDDICREILEKINDETKKFRN